MLSTFHHKDFLSCRQIDNPDYKGPWVHPEIDNPEYNPDDAKDIGKYAENFKIGFDLWQVRSRDQPMFCNKLLPTCQPPLSYNWRCLQVKSGTIFDNMMITDDPAEAKAAGESLWAVTKEAEKKMKDAQDEEERAKAEAEAGEKGEDEDDEDLDDVEEDDEEEVKEAEDDEAEVRVNQRWNMTTLSQPPTSFRATMSCEMVKLLVFIKHHKLVLCGAFVQASVGS